MEIKGDERGDGEERVMVPRDCSFIRQVWKSITLASSLNSAFM